MTKELNRKALYDLVWSKPMSTIAKDYGLSDRGMAKLCDRNSIPVPPRGYWAKKAAGKKVHKPPLIVFDEKEPDTAILLREAQPVRESITTVNKKEEPVLPASIQEAIARETLPENQIKVPATMHKPHRIIDEWIKTEDREAELDRKYGRTSYRPPVTPLERRKRRIMSTLFKELEARGFKIEEEGGRYYHKDLWIIYERDKVSIHMNERIKQYRRELTDEEKAEHSRYFSSKQKWTQVKEQTGKLEISLEPEGFSYSKIKIQEDDAKPFEEMLNDVVVKVIEAMWEAKSRRLKKEEDERQQRKKEHECYLQRQAAEAEQKRRINLEKKALFWKRAQTIREYISAVEKSREQGQLQVDDTEFIKWRTWAMAYADGIDFIANGNPLINLSEAPEDIDTGESKAPNYNDAQSSSSGWFPGKQWYHK